MRKLSLFVATLCLSAQLATAQIRLPQPSPGASVMQTIGVTDITINYSRPAVRGRDIFGTVVPYGQVWRTGANGATKFTTTTDVMVEGQPLPAGTYSVFSIPAQDEWTLIFNKNPTANTEAYKQDMDALRVKIKPTMLTDKAENFTIGFTDMTDSTARLNIVWANVRAGAMLMVNTSANAVAGVEKAVADKPEDPAILQAAASYNLSKNRNLEQALAWADKSIGLKETYRNVWLKAQILAKLNKPAEALPLAQKALTLGEANQDANYPFFKDAISKGVTDYTAMLPKVMETGKKKKK